MNIYKIVLKDVDYVPQYKKVLAEIFMKKKSTTSQIKTPIKGIRIRKRKNITEEVIKEHKNGIKVVRVDTVNMNFNNRDKIIFRSYKKHNENLNKLLIDSDHISFTEDIIREQNILVPEREYCLSRFCPVTNNNKTRFSKTFIKDKCYYIFDAYLEYINKNQKNLIFEVEPIDNVI